MIAFLDGVLAEKLPTSVVLDVNGVGYDALIPLSTYDRLPGTGQRCRLLTCHIVREDDQFLCGFTTADEKRLFELLTGVSGVGPKLALGVLSGLTVREVRAAIASGDVKRLSSVRGIGRKTAERLVLELRDRVDPTEALTGGTDPAANVVPRDTILALTALGFPADQARKMVQAALDAGADSADTKALLKQALAGR